METYQTMQYGPTFPLDEAGKFLYEYNKRKTRIYPLEDIQNKN